MSDDVIDEPPTVPVPAGEPEADPDPDAPPATFRRIDYRCDAGGTATVLSYQSLLGSPLLDAFSIYEGCALDDRVLDGATRTRDQRARSSFSGTGAAGFSVTTADGRVRTLDGVSVLRANSLVVRSDIAELSGVDYTEEDAAGELRVTGHDARLHAEIDDISAG